MRELQRLSYIFLTIGLVWLIAGLSNEAGLGVGVRVNRTAYVKNAVKRSQPVHFSFVVQNVSLIPVLVRSIPACGCTTTKEPGSGWLMPTRAMSVTGKIDTTGMVVGHHSKDVIVRLRAGVRIWEEVVHIQFSVDG